MPIKYKESSKEFHIYNSKISYIIQILKNDQLGNIYFGKRLNDKTDFSYLSRTKNCSLAVYTDEMNDKKISLQYIQQEYPSYGTSDFRYPAFEITQENGSKISDFKYRSHVIYEGKKKLQGLPATYVDTPLEATTLEVELYDTVMDACIVLTYSIFNDFPVVCRNSKVMNESSQKLILNKIMSANIDFPNSDFEMIHLAGAWSRERYVKKRKIEEGIQGIYSMRGASSSEHNPFFILKRPNTDENVGEAYGFSLVYSGNHLQLVDVDHNNTTRVMLGIHPDTFSWSLGKKEVFQSPEAVLVYSDKGLNDLSQTFHKLYRTRLVRGIWREKERPILINNWEATEMSFTEDKILEIAKIGKELGMELFVLDDGWFGARDSDRAGLGDWYVKNYKKLPSGIMGLADKIDKMGMKFGLWFEPEMVNKDSDLYRAHPDWLIHTPERFESTSRNQFVLDFSRAEVVNYIYGLMDNILSQSKISYVKWDMNRYITECYSVVKKPEEQGKVFHQYILGVYDLYERLLTKFPEILFESCSSGGSRFDPGMLFYAPQAWTSDDTDAIERVKIQYGSSYCYPICSMGAHVSKVPNNQTGRVTPLETRANVAYFGVFGYELDLTELTEEERNKVKEQIVFNKEHRTLIQQGNFYRLQSPFEENIAAWMVVAQDKSEALVGYYHIYTTVNDGWKYIKLSGIDENKKYSINGKQISYGDELMYIGIMLEPGEQSAPKADYSSEIFYLKEVKE